MKRIALILGLGLIAAPALADQGYLSVGKNTAGLTAVALNAAAATRTITVNLTDKETATTTGANAVYSKLLVTVDYTYSEATTVTAQLTCALDGSTYGRRTSNSTASGATTIYAETGTYTTGAASITLNLEYGVKGCKSVKVLFGGASAAAGDIVTVNYTPIAGS